MFVLMQLGLVIFLANGLKNQVEGSSVENWSLLQILFSDIKNPTTLVVTQGKGNDTWVCRLLGWKAQAIFRLPRPLENAHCIMRIDSNKEIQLSLAMRQSKTPGWHFRDFIRHVNLSIFSLCLETATMKIQIWENREGIAIKPSSVEQFILYQAIKTGRVPYGLDGVHLSSAWPMPSHSPQHSGFSMTGSTPRSGVSSSGHNSPHSRHAADHIEESYQIKDEESGVFNIQENEFWSFICLQQAEQFLLFSLSDINETHGDPWALPALYQHFRDWS